MQKKIYVFLFSLISIISYSQKNYQLDSMLYYHWDETINDWKLKKIDQIQYINEVDFYTYKIDIQKEARVFKSKKLMEHDASKNPIKDTSFKCRDIDTCRPASQLNKIYDNLDNLIKISFSSYDTITKQWKPNRTIEYIEYDEFRNYKEERFADVNRDLEFEIYARNINQYFYDKNVLDSLIMTSSNHGSELKRYFKYHYSDDGLKLKEMEYAEEVYKYSEETYSYDSRKNLIETLTQKGRQTTRRRYYYDEFKNLKFEIYDKLKNNEWFGQSQKEYFWSEH